MGYTIREDRIPSTGRCEILLGREIDPALAGGARIACGDSLEVLW
ncbi:MAG: hypothetical protein WD733_12945 [Bryobacterales bacterium]